MPGVSPIKFQVDNPALLCYISSTIESRKMATKHRGKKRFRKTFCWVGMLFILQTLQVFPGDIFSSCSTGCLSPGCVPSGCLPSGLLSAAAINRAASSTPSHILSVSASALHLRPGVPCNNCQTIKQHILMGEEEIPLPSRDSNYPDDLQTCARTHRSSRTFPEQKPGVPGTVFYTSSRSSSIFLFNQAFRI